MTPLRQRMLEDMRLRDFSPHTQESYLGVVFILSIRLRSKPERLAQRS